MSKNKNKKMAITKPSQAEVNLVCRWWDRAKEADNGLEIAVYEGPDKGDCIKFKVRGTDIHEEGYENLLCAKIYETFGVYDPNIASSAISECINAMMERLHSQPGAKWEGLFNRLCGNLMSLFQEMGSRDVFELMLIKKMIILDSMSTQELIAANNAPTSDSRSLYQSRGIKLSRLVLECKEKLDKYRKPEQQIHVQHNHIHNEGQAIIGSQFTSGGG